MLYERWYQKKNNTRPLSPWTRKTICLLREDKSVSGKITKDTIILSSNAENGVGNSPPHSIMEIDDIPLSCLDPLGNWKLGIRIKIKGPASREGVIKWQHDTKKQISEVLNDCVNTETIEKIKRLLLIV